MNLSQYVSVLILSILLILTAALVGYASHKIANRIIRLFSIIFKTHAKENRLIVKYHLIDRIIYLVPAILFNQTAYLFNIETTYIKLYLADLVKAVTTIYIIFGIVLVITAMLNCLHDHYKNLDIAKQRPIKSYLQVIKIFLFIVGFILSVSVLTDKSPTYFLTSLGALTAIILLVFKDSILGFVASIQLAAYDMLRIGDEIEMFNYGADGEVIDISLNTVKVQNYDKSIVTIPSYALLSTGMKNWRGMKESGGRRIKRSINIDITSIKICDDELLNRLSKLVLLKNKLAEKITQVKNYNLKHDIDTNIPANGRQLTNIGLFRYYLENYLRQHPGIRNDMRILVRQLQTTPNGLPMELYAFANDISSERYEAIQADIIDHIYAILSFFDLRPFQYATTLIKE